MGLDEPVKAEMYFPYQQIKDQAWYTPRDLVIRTSGDTSSLVGAVRQIIREVDPDQPVSNVATMAELLGTEASQRRMGMITLVAFARCARVICPRAARRKSTRWWHCATSKTSRGFSQIDAD